MSDDLFIIDARKDMSEDGFALNSACVARLSRHRHSVTKRVNHKVPHMLKMKIDLEVGNPLRKFVLCEYSFARKIVYFYADKATGTLYRPHTGRCMTSDMLEIAL